MLEAVSIHIFLLYRPLAFLKRFYWLSVGGRCRYYRLDRSAVQSACFHKMPQQWDKHLIISPIQLLWKHQFLPPFGKQVWTLAHVRSQPINVQSNFSHKPFQVSAQKDSMQHIIFIFCPLLLSSRPVLLRFCL